MLTMQKEACPRDKIKIIDDNSLDKSRFKIDAGFVQSRVEYHNKCLLGSFKGDMNFFFLLGVTELGK